MEHGQNKLKYDQKYGLALLFFRADIKILQHVLFMGGWIKGNLCWREVFVKSYAFVFFGAFQKYFWFEKY